MIKFEGYERRIDKIMGVLKEYGIASLEDAQKICLDKGVDCDAIVKGIQPIAFDNAVWAYTVVELSRLRLDALLPKELL